MKPSGTKISVQATSLEPVPFNPAACQVSSDLVLRAVEQEDPVVLRPAAAIVDHAGQHVPGRGTDAGGKGPAAGQEIAARGGPRLPGGEDEGRGDQRIAVLVPDAVLRLLGKHRQHPVVARQVRQVPCRGSAAAGEDRADIDEGAEIKLRAAERGRLEHPEEAGIVQVANRLGRKLPQLLRPLRALGEYRYEIAGAGAQRCIGCVLLHQ